MFTAPPLSPPFSLFLPGPEQRVLPNPSSCRAGGPWGGGKAGESTVKATYLATTKPKNVYVKFRKK